MKKKSKEWINASLGITKNTVRPYIKNFTESAAKIVGSSRGYSVHATMDLNPGDVIEEVPVLTLHTTLQDIVDAGEDADPVLASYFVPHTSYNQEFAKEGIPLIMGLGNYAAYRRAESSNASYSFDPTFNIITIRATKQISAGSEIIFPSTLNKKEEPSSDKKEKKMGCGCGKKKAQQAKQEQPKQEQPVKTDEVKSSKFKSMVDGKELNSIKVD
jgi:hypothetical protein